MILRSIKWRLQLWHALILLVVLSGFGYTAFELQRTREWRRVDQELHDRTALLLGPRRPGRPPGQRGPFSRGTEPAEREGPGPGEPPRREPGPPFLAEMERQAEAAFPEDGLFFFGVWERGGRLTRSRWLPQGIAPTSSRPQAGIFQMGEYRVLQQVTPRGDSVLIGRSITAEQKELRNLALVLGISGAAILLVGLAGGWLVATRAMRPIEHISSTAQKIATGDLSQRISHEESESEFGRLIATLNSTFARLENAFTEQVRFTTDVSHELRTPVSVIVSQSQMALARDRSAPEYREALEACQRAAQRMRRLIESLLQLARLDAGQESIRSNTFDLAETVRDCGQLLQPLADQRKLQLRFDLKPALVLGDSDKIAQVVTNLVSNAIQYTPEQGAIVISTRIQDLLGVLSVRDTGPGIPAEDLPHIFDRFYRVDTSRSRDKGGSGLGLAIARAIVHAHGGSIAVTSELGKGAEFIVRLPSAGGSL